jgi:hypothetical protein
MNTWHLRHSHIGFFNPYHLANFLNWWDEAFVPSHELATICCNMLPYHHRSHKNVIIVEMCISSVFLKVYWSLCLKFSQIKLILQKIWIFVKEHISQWKTHFPNFFQIFIAKQQKHCPKANHRLKHYESNPRFQISYLTLKCQVSHPNFQM